MDGLIVVEVIGRGGQVQQRVKLAALPATIGRSYAADVILDDPFADALHARLARDGTGALVVEDAGSTNGLAASEHGERLDRITLAPGAVFRVGHTMLRVATPDMPVPPALRDDRRLSRSLRRLESRGLAAALTLGGAIAFGLSVYLASSDAQGGEDFAAGAFGVFGFVLAWAGAWALGTRMRAGQARFLAHYNVAWIAFLLVLAVNEVEGWYRFFAGDVPAAAAVAAVAFFASAIAPVYGNLTVASRLTRTSRLLIGGAAAAVMLGLAELGDMGSDYGSAISVTMPLKPVPPGLLPAQEAAVFLEDIAALQQEVDEAARTTTGDDAPSVAPDSANAAPSARRTSRAP